MPSLRTLSLVALCCLSLVATACREQALMTGAVAVVNGETISFKDMETRRALLFSGRSARAHESGDSVLQEQYRYVLGKMLEERIICQYMENAGLRIGPDAVEAEERRIREDYPPEAFAAMLLELAIDEETWRENIYRRLTVEQFLLQVLRPEVSISAEEVQDYYRRHSAEFIIPEQWHFIQIAGADRGEVDKAARMLVSSKNATSVQQNAFVTIHDISMGADMLPKDLLDDLAPLGEWQASRVRNAEDAFRAFVLVEKTPSVMLDAAETSKRVEAALTEEKIGAVYADWMRGRLRKADIRIAPVLTRPFPAEQGAALPVPPGDDPFPAGMTSHPDSETSAGQQP